MPSAKEALKSAYYELAEENWAAFCSHNTSDEGTPIFLEMNVTSEDVGLNLTYLREPENSPPPATSANTQRRMARHIFGL